MSKLGLRFERLLFLSAPITLASLVVLAVSFASQGQEELARARCFSGVAKALEERKSVLDKSWDIYKQKLSDKLLEIDYRHELRLAIIPAHLEPSCYRRMAYQELDARSSASPAELIEKLRADAEALRKVPLKIRGVDLPEKATLSVFGTAVRIEMLTFTSILQIGLAPALVVWLGSLFGTRYRESVLVGAARDISGIFPHVINVYPVGKLPEPKKKNWFAYYAPLVASVVYALTRVVLLLILIGPSVFAYIFGLYFSPFEDYGFLSFALGVTVSIFFLFTIMVEFLPWHFRKMFPMPAGRGREG